MASQSLLAGGGVNDATVGTPSWANPGNITASDDVRAVVTVQSSIPSRYLRSTSHGFAIPTGATIDGIVAQIERHREGGVLTDSAVRLAKGGAPGGTNKASGSTWPTSDGTATYGSATDLWGQTWTPAEINDAGFGLCLSATKTAGAMEARVDAMRLIVYYTEASTRRNRIRSGGSMLDKPLLVKQSGAFVEKPVRVKTGGSFA